MKRWDGFSGTVYICQVLARSGRRQGDVSSEHSLSCSHTHRKKCCK